MNPNVYPFLWSTHSARWMRYLLPLVMMIGGYSAKAATYYWVGGSGSWNELHHWAATSGGAGGAFNTPPTANDDVIFDRLSFNASLQTVTCSTAATCRNLNLSAATSVYSSTSTAPTINISSSLSVFGNISMPSQLKCSITGSILLESPGQQTFDIRCSVSGTGSIQFNHAAAVWSVLNNLTFSAGNLVLNRGTLNTNGKLITIRYFTSTTADARTLNCGSSKIQLRPVSVNNNVFWNIANPSTFTLNAGSGTVEFYTTTSNISAVFQGAGLKYNIINVNMPASSATSTAVVNNVVFEGNNTFGKVIFTRGTGLFNGDNTFEGALNLCNGHRYRFKFGSTQTFNSTASFTTAGTASSPIYIQSTSSTAYATFTKPAGIVCTDYMYISNIRAIGGASWNSASTNFNQTPSFISGWNFGGSAAQISATITGGRKCKGEPFNLKLTFSGTTFPVTCVLENTVTGQRDTIEDIINATYYHQVNPAQSALYRVAQVSSSGCYTTVANLTGIQDSVIIPNYSGRAKWVGRRSADWYDCNNWENNFVPEDTIDVIIEPNSTMTQPIIAAGVAETKAIEIAYDADLTLFGSTTEFHVFGDFINNGTFTPNDAKVAFIGNDVLQISGGEYTTLAINNTTPDGIALQDTVVVTGTLMLNDGIVNTNGNMIKVTNPNPQAIGNFGQDNYINGVLERAIEDSATYSFPVGDDVIYALCEVRATGSTGGVTKLKVQFINHPGSSEGLNIPIEGGDPINSIHPAGIWLIEPDQQPIFGGGVSGDYELTFHLDGFPNMAGYNFYILTRHDTSMNAADWRLASMVSGNEVVDGKITVSGITHFSQWGIGQGGGSTLPVKMTSFKAVPVDNKFIQLKWTTETEINNSGFLVERSTDGQEFTSIGFVPGMGNTTEAQSYTYNDKNVEAKKRYYYRLKQIDEDGASEYTKVVSAILNGGDKTQRIGEFIPNPTSSIANVEIYSALDQKVTIEFKNTMGQVVKKGDVMLRKGSSTYRLDVSDLATGNYLVVINTEEQVYTKKLVVKN